MFKRILIADDTESMSELLQRQLERAEVKASILTAKSAEEVRRVVDSIHFDLVTIDDLDGGGVDLARELYGCGIPVLLTSVRSGDAPEVPHVVKGSNNFFDQYVAKVREMLG